jgi:hypothetical protein
MRSIEERNWLDRENLLVCMLLETLPKRECCYRLLIRGPDENRHPRAVSRRARRSIRLR